MDIDHKAEVHQEMLTSAKDIGRRFSEETGQDSTHWAYLTAFADDVLQRPFLEVEKADLPAARSMLSQTLEDIVKRFAVSGLEQPEVPASEPEALVSPVQPQGLAGQIPQAAERTAFLIDTLGSGAEVARLLGVHRSQPWQWRAGKESPSPRVAQQLLDLDYVLAKAQLIWPPKAALDWLNGSNEYLDGARPIDVLKLRGASDVIKALNVAMA